MHALTIPSRKHRRRDASFVPTLCAALMSACTVGVGGTGTLSGGTGTTGGTTGTTSTTGFNDPQACAPEDCPPVLDDSGGQVAQCCEGEQPSINLNDAGCPGPKYPSDWSCNGQDECENAGCVDHDDCLFDTLTCRTVGGTNFCVVVCVTDADCVAMPGTLCIGAIDNSTDEFCLQEIL